MFKYLAKRPLWVNVLFAFGFVCILVAIFLFSLEALTRHGKSLNVPAVTGMHLSEAQKMLSEKGFDLMVQDSLYFDSLPPGMVLKQVPDADEVVKINRTVYITINRVVPPDVDMPNLRGYSYRNAAMVLSNLGLRVGDTTYRPDFAKNSVLEQNFNGNPIEPGTKIRMGSRISLVLGSGVGSDYVAVPDLFGMTYDEARALLDANGIIIGAVLPDPGVTDTLSSFVYWQRPSPRTEDGKRLSMRPGQMMDMRLQTEKPERPVATTDSTAVENEMPEEFPQ